MGQLPDALLLDHFRRGDAIALETLFERYEPTLFPFLMGLLRDHQSAEDALQETFVKALTRQSEIDPDKFRNWLFTVGYREAMQLRRRTKRMMTSESELLHQVADSHPDGSTVAETEEDSKRIRKLLDRLPNPQKEVIVARIYRGLRFKEIANELGCPLNTALARMHEGLKKLRSLWEAGHV